MKDGRLGEAKILYQNVLKKEPRNADGNFGLAEVYRKTEDADSAIEFYEKAHNDGHHEATFRLARATKDKDLLKVAAAKGHVQSALYFARVRFREAARLPRKSDKYNAALLEAETFLRRIADRNADARYQLAVVLREKDPQDPDWEYEAYLAAFQGHVGAILLHHVPTLLSQDKYQKAAEIVLKIANRDSEKRTKNDGTEKLYQYRIAFRGEADLTIENYVVDARLILASLVGGVYRWEFPLAGVARIEYETWRRALNLNLNEGVGYFWLHLANNFLPPGSGHHNPVSSASKKYSIDADLIDQWKPSYLVESGSGFFVADTTIVTAYHVLEDCDEVRAGLHKINRFPALDQPSDLAILELSTGNRRDEGYLDILRTYPPDDLPQRIYTFGYPNDQEYWTDGSLYNVAPDTEASSTIWLYHNAPTNPGHSGGAVLDQFGRVIGVASSTYSIINQAMLNKVLLNRKAAIVQGQFRASWIGNLLEKKHLRDSQEPGDKPDPQTIRNKTKKYSIPITCWKNVP